MITKINKQFNVHLLVLITAFRDLDQQELCDVCGMELDRLHQIIKGDLPTIEELHIFADQLEVMPAFFYREGKLEGYHYTNQGKIPVEDIYAHLFYTGE